MGMVGTHEPQYRHVQDRVRVFNKRILNPATLRLAGRPFSPYGIVRHEGRESGRTYDTPVLVGTVGDQFVVPLPYGTDADWYQNVRAADGCTVVWRGRAYRAESPRLVVPSAVPEAFPAWMQRLVQRGGAVQYLRMERGEEVPMEYGKIAEQYPARAAVVGVAGAVLLAAVLWRVGIRDRE